MCFDKKYNPLTRKPQPKKAKKDIIVFKVIGRHGNGMIYDLFIKGKNEVWTPGYWYTEKTPFVGSTFDSFSGWFSVYGNAFHSLKTKILAKDKQTYWGGTKVVKMIIPKGALYYENEKEYVSSQIIYPT